MKAVLVLGILTCAAGASMALAGHQKPARRVILHGHQIRYNGLGPERWARRYRIEHNRFLAEQRHRRRLQREFRRRLHTLSLRRLQARQPDHIPPVGWRAKQIQAAETIAAESSGDPWPNCPDPHDGSGSSWDDTVNCENGGDWNDSPGYFRCGLQFEPMWERRFGALCP